MPKIIQSKYFQAEKIKKMGPESYRIFGPPDYSNVLPLVIVGGGVRLTLEALDGVYEAGIKAGLEKKEERRG